MRRQPGIIIIKKNHELDKNQKRALKFSRPPAEYISLEQRRREADLCEVFKYMRGFNRFIPDKLCNRSVSKQKSYSRTDVRNHLFTIRIIDPWNRLPKEVVTALTASLSIFEKRLRSVATG